jgi:hypothetical protein
MILVGKKDSGWYGLMERCCPKPSSRKRDGFGGDGGFLRACVLCPEAVLAFLRACLFWAEEDDVIQSVERDPSRWKHLFKSCC